MWCHQTSVSLAFFLISSHYLGLNTAIVTGSAQQKKQAEPPISSRKNKRGSHKEVENISETEKMENLGKLALKVAYKSLGLPLPLTCIDVIDFKYLQKDFEN